MKSSYYIAVHTGKNYDHTEYARAAGVLANMLTGTLCSDNYENVLLKGAVEEVRNELEIGLVQNEQGWELVGECVVDCTGPGKMSLDKPALSKMLKGSPLNEWGDRLKVIKKAVPDV